MGCCKNFEFISHVHELLKDCTFPQSNWLLQEVREHWEPRPFPSLILSGNMWITQLKWWLIYYVNQMHSTGFFHFAVFLIPLNIKLLRRSLFQKIFSPWERYTEMKWLFIWVVYYTCSVTEECIFRLLCLMIFLSIF